LFKLNFSIAIIRQYAERRKKIALATDPSRPPGGLKILEAFSASGLRSIRYAKEIVSIDAKSERLIDEIIANDISKRAVERIQVSKSIKLFFRHH
jgi:tRNA G26 N,N-dimethylase Trm1